MLNAVFANKKIPRVVTAVTIENPNLEKESIEDKYSILDIRAGLDDGTSVLIEMHMYSLGELKAKTIRTWAKSFGSYLVSGDRYTGQPPTVSIAFTNGQVEPLRKSAAATNKIHSLCMIMDCEDFSVLSDAMELHYIDMKAFAKAVNEAGNLNAGVTEEAMLAKWLSVITQKEITDKTIIENACKDEEELKMAISTLALQGEDKNLRFDYERRQTEIYYDNKEKYDLNCRIAEQAVQLEEKDIQLEEKDIQLKELATLIAELRLRRGGG
ncbi:MAG: Rpn family recombination-promoting nuclease/putative transposase [Defluviitaleaceae bacterium]|nr:Rpn family recombination-promoting nuclease/putative transposase [Defluviitaleaceae bacterium]